MKDLFGNARPVEIEVEEWWFNGRIIQKQKHPMLSLYISFADDNSPYVQTHSTFKEAKEFCAKNPCCNPLNFPHNYIGGIK